MASPKTAFFCNIHNIHPKNKYSTSSVLELMNASTISYPTTYIKKTRRNSSVTPPKIGTQKMQKNQNRTSSTKKRHNKDPSLALFEGNKGGKEVKGKTSCEWQAEDKGEV